MANSLRKLARGVFVVLSLGSAASAAASMVFESSFAAAGSGGSNGNYFAAGQQATQTFINTQLDEINALRLTLNLRNPPFQFNSLHPGATIGFAFFLNGQEIGQPINARSDEYTNGDYAPHVLEFAFPWLLSAAQSWTLKMEVTTARCPNPPQNCGAVGFASDNPLTLFAIPEPATLALFALGLAGVRSSRRKRQ